MTAHYRMTSLTPEEASRWEDLLAPYHTRELFHGRPWLDYLAESRGIEVKTFRIQDGDRVLGYFAAGLERKGPYRILGSPLKGWGTNFMGPIADADFDEDAFLASLDTLASQLGIAMLELEGRYLTPRLMDRWGYQATLGWTYEVRLTPGEEAPMWDTLDSTCRNRLRKAERFGLTVEDTDDPRIADDFYGQYVDVMRRKGLIPPYPREYPHLLVRHLKKAEQLFALRVRNSAGRILATGLYPHDERTVYFWGGASWEEHRELCPNEYLHWSAMRLAAARGLRRYDMCGYGRFKKKFGGRLVLLKRWHKFYSRSARWARRGYELYFERQMRLGAWLQRLVIPGG